jgi:hypothetical protein
MALPGALLEFQGMIAIYSESLVTMFPIPVMG